MNDEEANKLKPNAKEKRKPHVKSFTITNAAEAQASGAQCSDCKLATNVAHVPMCCPKTIRDLKVGQTYRWCSCGKTTDGVWCDGTSCLPGFVPVEFTVNVEQSIWSICNCKYTKQPPLCDGTHGSMPATPTVSPCACKRELQW